MKNYFILFLLFFSGFVIASGPEIELDKAPINLHDMQSIKRGATFFATNCMMCHTMVYLRYNQLAKQAGITYDKMPIHVKNWPLNVVPPDLSLETDVRGVDWVYTYLHSFYIDPTRPTGFNNLLLPNTAMAGILAAYQGQQVLVKTPYASQHIVDYHLQWYDLIELQSQGSMTATEFDATMTDVVNFLAFAAAPYYAEQTYLGYWVIGFLLLLLVLVYLLKKEYWKDINRE